MFVGSGGYRRHVGSVMLSAKVGGHIGLEFWQRAQSFMQRALSNQYKYDIQEGHLGTLDQLAN